MTIGFKKLPSNLRVPGAYFEIDPSNANTPQQNLRALIIGQVLAGTPYAAAGTVATPQISLGAADAAANAGYSSQLALMVVQYKARDSFGELWVLPLIDDAAAVAASGSIAFTGTATITGTLPLYIDFMFVPVLVTAGTTSTALATSVAAAVNAMPSVPVTATASTGTVTFAADNKGLAGNDIDVRLAYRGSVAGEVVPAGIAAVITPLSGGTTNPALATALLSLADLPFEVIISPYTDANSQTALAALMDDSTGRWSWQRKLYGHVYAAKSATLSAATTFGATVNNQHLSVLPMWSCPMQPARVAADYGAAIMESVRADPALPLQYVPTNIPAPAPPNRFIISDRQTLLFDGLSTYRVDGGVVNIERVVTTYQTNAAGASDTSYLDAETMHCLGAICRDLDSYLITRFARQKLALDGTRVTGGSNIVVPAVIKATLDTRYQYLCEVVGIAQDPDGFAAESRVELAGLGRVNVLAPIRIMGQLRIMAILVSFTKPT